MTDVKLVYCLDLLDSAEYVEQFDSLYENGYKLVGYGGNIFKLFNYFEDTVIDYLIIITHNKTIDGQLLKTIKSAQFFNYIDIIIVADERPNLQNWHYNFVPHHLVGNDLFTILNIFDREDGKEYITNYSFENYYKKCSEVLIKVGLNSKLEGFKYLIFCSYLYAVNNKFGKMYSNTYSNAARFYKTQIDNIERNIRTSINSIQQPSEDAPKEVHNIYNTIGSMTNKKAITELSEYMWKNIL